MSTYEKPSWIKYALPNFGLTLHIKKQSGRGKRLDLVGPYLSAHF